MVKKTGTSLMAIDPDGEKERRGEWRYYGNVMGIGDVMGIGHAWKQFGIWSSHSKEILILKGNLCNLEGNVII